MTDPVAAAHDVDGRRQRAERNRVAVVDALLSLYDEGVVRPGAAEVARRAGVSTRSVFRHFDDLEVLAQAAIDRQWARVRGLYEPPDPGGDVRARTAALVDQRLRLHAAIIGIARAAVVLALSSPTVAATMRDRHRLLARQVAELFASELHGLRPPERRELGAALESAASLEHVDYLRTHAGLSAPDAGAVLRRTLLALLAAPSGRTGR